MDKIMQETIISNGGKQGGVSPEEILDRTEACQKLGISRQTLLAWIRKGKLKVWKRVGSGSNSALLFHRDDIAALAGSSTPIGHPAPSMAPSSSVTTKTL